MREVCVCHMRAQRRLTHLPALARVALKLLVKTVQLNHAVLDASSNKYAMSLGKPGLEMLVARAHLLSCS